MRGVARSPLDGTFAAQSRRRSASDPERAAAVVSVLGRHHRTTRRTGMTSSASAPASDRNVLLPAHSPDDYRLRLGTAFLIAVYGASLLLIHLGDVRALTFHEIIFAQPAREMLADGNYLVPTIGGLPNFDRTPVTAWAISLSMALFQSDAEWVARFPIVVF
jgi:hypothetical protein